MVSDKALCFVLDQKGTGEEEGEPKKKKRKKEPKKATKDKKAHQPGKFQFHFQCIELARPLA